MSSISIHDFVRRVSPGQTNDTLQFSALSFFLMNFPSKRKLLLGAPFPLFDVSQTKTFSSFLNTTVLYLFYILQSFGHKYTFHIVQIYCELS